MTLSKGLRNLLIGLVALLAACGQQERNVPAHSDNKAMGGEPIKIGAVFDLTGATADVGKPYSQGQIAFIEWKNAQEGIAGHRIELISQDYAYEIARAEELYTQFVTQDEVVAFSGWGTGDTEQLKARIAQDEIPFISASYSANLANPAETPYNFLVGTTYSDQLIIAQKWALADWKAKGHRNLPKFAYLVNDSPFGKSPLPDGAAHAEENGVVTPLEAPSPRGTTDLTPQLTQIRDYGANYIFLQNVSTPAQLALKAAQDLGYDAQFVCLNWCANELTIKLAGAAAEDLVGTIPFAHVDAHGATVALDYALEKSIDIGGAESNFVQGWWAMAILVEGIERTVEEGQELNGRNIKATLETLNNFDTGGVTQPISFSTTDHRGSTALQMFQVNNGKWKPITELLSAE